MHDHHTGNGHASREGIAQLSHALEKTWDQNRTLLEEMARFTKDETLRLAHLHLDRTNSAFAHFGERRDFGGLINAQQEWAKQTMQDYAALGLRTAEMFHTLTLQVQSHVQDTASEFRHQAEAEMEDLGHDLNSRAGAYAGAHGEQPHLPAE